MNLRKRSPFTVSGKAAITQVASIISVVGRMYKMVLA